MKFGTAKPISRAVGALTGLLLLSGWALCGQAASALRATTYLGPPQPVKRLAKPLSSYKPGELPLQRISKRQAEEWKAQNQRIARAYGQQGAAVNAPVPPATQSQFIDLTTNPRPPLVGPSTRSQEKHPNWSWDQQTIFFASNNVDPIASYGLTTPPTSARFHIYRMTSDGAFIQQVTGLNIPGEATGEQLFPSINRAQTKLAYAHRDNIGEPYQLYILDFFTGQRQQMTGVSVVNNPLNANLVNIEKPSWVPGDNRIVFAARNKSISNDVRNVYVIDVNSKVVAKITNGTATNGVECIDPVAHPDNNRVTFAANTGNPANGVAVAPSGDLNYVENPLQDLNGDTRIDELDHNLFSMPITGPTAGAPAVQITTATADDIEPAYQQSDYPPGQGAGAFNNWLAFASKGRQPLPGTPIGRTFDIYFNNGGPEGTNLPVRLFTPDTNAGAIPLNKSEERYPTWSSALPPQNPIDRIAFSSNRQNNVNDQFKPTVSATDTDIWAAEVSDITPPTLFSFDETLGETLHIANAPLPNPGRRIGTPGDTFYFYAKVQDLQYGVESVWLQIKDPDGASTDVRGVNHKLYGVGQFPGTNSPFNNVYTARWNGTPAPTHYIHLPFETDYHGIGVSDYQYFSDSVRDDDANFSRARMASKLPGVDDSVRWSGNQLSQFNPIPTSNRPPLDSAGNNRWLRLSDDGRSPDLVAGDSIYSAQWDTPNDASDFYVDLIAYDKAPNPEDLDEQQNWIVYDNIWGFSTQSLAARNPILFVDDNGSGQKWPRGLKGSFRLFPTYRYGTESDIMDRPDQFTPRQWMPLTGDLQDIQDPGQSAGGFTLQEAFHFLNGNSVGYDFVNGLRDSVRAYRADCWRILAKGPLPETVINDYVPTTDEQPTNITGSSTIQRPVPRRAVVWSSPYTGDVFLGAGSILDQATQTLLTKYRNRSGRLVIAGGDIMWALTIDGQVQQTFAQDVLGATYVSDATANNSIVPFSGLQRPAIPGIITRDVFGTFEPFGAPPYWMPFYDPDPLDISALWGGFIDAQNTNTGVGGQTVHNGTGTPFQQQDNITPRPGWQVVFDPHVIVREDPATRSKTLFSSGSLASWGRRYITEGDDPEDDPLDCMNYRQKISHALFCWMFSADLVGQVRNLNGGAPIGGAWVQAYQGTTLVGSAFTRLDGTYAIRGLPVGGWTLRVDNPGFRSFSKATGNGAHGLSQSQEDVFLVPAAPGSISGKVEDQFGEPVPGVDVVATLLASPLFTGQREYRATTIADGTYLIPSAPTGDYDVVIDESTLPPGFSNPQPQFTPPVTVLPAQDTPNIDFIVTGSEGPLKVTVFAQLANGTRGAAVPGAEVNLVDATGALIPGFTAITNSAGVVNFTNVPAGPITVSVFKFGFQETTVVVNIPQEDEVEVLLPVASAKTLYGLAVRALDGRDLTPLELPVEFSLVRAASGVDTGLRAKVFAPAATAPVKHNFRFNNAQEGRFLVVLKDHPRFEDISVPVDITNVANPQTPAIQLVGKDGILSGQVNEDSGGQPGAAIANAQVLVESALLNPGTVVADVRTLANGSWNTGTTPIPSDLYTVTIRKFGYSTKVLQDVFVAGDTKVATTLLKKSQRGRIYGLARRSVDLVPRGGVLIEFFTAPTSEFGSTKVGETTSFAPPTNGPDGKPHNYGLGATADSAEFLPAGDYEIQVNSPRFQPFRKLVTLGGRQQLRVDLDLVPLQGILSGEVKEDLGGGRAGNPIAGAIVRVKRDDNTVAAQRTTDAQGAYATASALPPLHYTVTASAVGFIDGSVEVFVEGPTTAPVILLKRVPPSTVRGAVTSSVNGQAIGGVKVELLQGGNVVKSTTTANSLTGTPPSNYVITGVNSGSYVVRASKAGWQTAQRNLTIQPGVDATGVDLQLQPEHVFGKGLLLIALPYDFPGQDAANVLGIPPSEFKSAYWLTSESRYAIYPEAPARDFRLGKGMFVRFKQATAFSSSGPAAPAGPFNLAVKAGWNLIGNPRRQRVNWLDVGVRTSGGQVLTMQQAMDQGLVQNSLFGFVDSYFPSQVLDPFAGYFMRAFQDCTLIIPDPAQAAASSVLRKQALLPAAPGRSSHRNVTELFAEASELEEATRPPRAKAIRKRRLLGLRAASSAPMPTIRRRGEALPPGSGVRRVRLNS